VKPTIPRLNALPEAQRILWPQLATLGTEFVLYGGTALSLQVGGRQSVDFDFFTPSPLEIDRLVKDQAFLTKAQIQHRTKDTITFSVGSADNPVTVSFFGGLRFGRVSEPVRFPDNGLYSAGLLDLAAQKVKVIQQRAEAKDYLDIHKLLSEGISLEDSLGAARALYPEFNPAISLKALSYFDDIAHLPASVQQDLQVAASRVREMSPVTRKSISLLPDLGFADLEPEISDKGERGAASRRIEPEMEL
jgi:hypothetical protein